MTVIFEIFNGGHYILELFYITVNNSFTKSDIERDYQ